MSDDEPKNNKYTDPRRHGVVQVTFRSGPPAVYRLTIAGQLWASVEWSPRRRRWCIEDGVGQCLAHAEHIHGEDRTVEAARPIPDFRETVFPEPRATYLFAAGGASVARTFAYCRKARFLGSQSSGGSPRRPRRIMAKARASVASVASCERSS